MAKPRVKVPSSVKAGEVVQIKTLITHKMETGLRKDSDGNVIPQNIINSFVAKYNGEEVFSMTLHAAISANPYIAFNIKPQESGDLEMIWTDDAGETWSAKKSIDVN